MENNITKVPIATLFKAQYLDGEFKRYEFLCYYIALQSIFEGKDTKEMRAFYGELAIKVLQRGWHIGTWKRLQGLMSRMEKEGFIQTAPIRVRAADLWIGDGRHRFCCAAILDINEVFILRYPKAREQYIERSWLVENDFNPDIIERLDLAKERLTEKWMKRGVNL